MTSFLTDTEENIFEIKPNGNGYIISDFEFEVIVENGFFKIKSSEEFLDEIIMKINQKNLKNEDELFKELTKQYDKLMNIELENSPLYTGQDVFELENDNHDIKFVDRIRIKNEDFNNDLFLVTFEYLDPKYLWTLNRVSKTWKKLLENETLWKSICQRESIQKEKDSWKMEYKRNRSFAQFIFSESIGVNSLHMNFKPGKSAEKIVGTNAGHVCFLGDKFWDKGVIKFKLLLEKNDSQIQNWFSYGIIGTKETYNENSYSNKTNFQFSYSGDKTDYCGEYHRGVHNQKSKFDIKEGDVFVLTLDFNNLTLTSYNERSKITMTIYNIDHIPYRAHINLYGVNQKITVINN